jgi:hypothetical protein
VPAHLRRTKRSPYTPEQCSAIETLGREAAITVLANELDRVINPSIEQVA